VSDGPLAPYARRRRRAGGGMMTTVDADGVMLGVEHFGDAAAPLVLLTGGTTMLSWPDTLCAALARGGRHVVRYDLRDSGASTTVDPQAPAYTLRDLAADAAVAEFAARGAEILGDDPAAARATAERKWDRTPGTEPAVQMANQLGVVFAKLDCTPRWRERLPELAIPALVVHGRRDPFFPVGNGEALAREIPGARLLVLERAATAIPDAAADEVATAMLAL
jgi:pimeloyl-ACP methyl ester carboxylesterase